MAPGTAEGRSTTRTPAASRAAIFSAAVPEPPEMMAPAWPMRLPGGAVWPGDEADDRLGDVLLDEERGLLFVGAADLADHDDGFGRGVGLEEPEHVDERRADHRVAADADRGALPDAGPREGIDDFVGQGAGAGDDADRTGGVDEAGHDADLGLAGGDQSGAVRAEQARPARCWTWA